MYNIQGNTYIVYYCIRPEKLFSEKNDVFRKRGHSRDLNCALSQHIFSNGFTFFSLFIRQLCFKFTPQDADFHGASIGCRSGPTGQVEFFRVPFCFSQISCDHSVKKPILLRCPSVLEIIFSTPLARLFVPVYLSPPTPHALRGEFRGGKHQRSAFFDRK